MNAIRLLSSLVLLGVAGCGAGCGAGAAPVPASALPESTRAYYAARLAENAAGRYATLALSPLASLPSDPLLDTVVQWDRLRRDGYRASFAELSDFLRAHRGWPQETVLRRRAEKAIDVATPFAARRAYFAVLPPVTAAAKFRLAEALLVGRERDAAIMLARDAWDSAGLDSATETELLATFAPWLTPADHLSRADRLLWSGQTSAATRLLPRLSPDRAAWVQARVALQAGGAAADARAAALPVPLTDEPGTTFDRVNWLRRTGRQADARALMAATAFAPGLVVEPEAWLKLRVALARDALKASDARQAYALAGGHAAFALGRPLSDRSLGERAAYIDAEWVAGWVALRQLNRANDALGHFAAVRAAALTPVSQARGDYWAGRAAEAAGFKADALRYFGEAARHPDYFYGQLAHERLGRALSLPATLPLAVAATVRARFAADELVRATQALGALGERDRQTLFMRALVERADTPEQARLVADLAATIARPDLGVLIGKAARSEGELGLLDAAYPRLTLPVELDPDWTMIHAIARQESQFDRAVVSAANARGLMQLVPSTAAEQAGKLGLPYDTARLTADPVFNVTLGASYFNRLRTNLASVPLAVAAYNAGGGNVRKFIAANGDPRLAGVDMIDWIEAIPFLETRTYVQRVLENAVVYDVLRPATAGSQGVYRLSGYLGKAAG